MTRLLDVLVPVRMPSLLAVHFASSLGLCERGLRRPGDV
jgi:hypothetical protein